MENETDFSTREDGEALNELIALGLIETIRIGDESAYRLSKSLDTAEFIPNAALCARLEKNDGAAYRE